MNKRTDISERGHTRNEIKHQTHQTPEDIGDVLDAWSAAGGGLKIARAPVGEPEADALKIYTVNRSIEIDIDASGNTARTVKHQILDEYVLLHE